MILQPPVPPTLESGPAWEVARLFPDQGDWGDGDYLALNLMTNRLVELVDGRVEVLEMPPKSHQLIMLFLRDTLKAFVDARDKGEVLVAPYPVRIREGRYREPDVLYVLAEHADRLTEEYADGCDVVMEVVSRDRDRDFVKKRRDYADAGIPEYWIVDPRDRRITVLRLERGAYQLHGEFGAGDRATSVVVQGFEVEARDVFAAGGI